MAVIPFPGEFQRHLVSRLNVAPTFDNYLAALEQCLRRGHDTAPIAEWWRANSTRVRFENSELDFVSFLKKIRLGPHSWETQKANIIRDSHEYLKSREAKEQTYEDSSSLIKAIIADIGDFQSRREFAVRNRQYVSTPWARDWIPLFKPYFGETGPLEVIAKYLNQFLDLSHVIEKSPQGFTPPTIEDLKLQFEDLKLRLLDRPAWVELGGDTHRHLLKLAAWVGRNEHPESEVVFRYILSSPEDRVKASPDPVMRAATRCTHGLFAYLISYYLDLNVASILLEALRLPLAVEPDPKGPPHLAPEFLFLSDQFNESRGYSYDCPDEIYPLMISAWKQFFKRYRDLRIQMNNGRTFADSAMLFQVALLSTQGEEECYETEGCDCLERLFADLEPDLFCALDYFNDQYFPYLFDMVHDVLETDRNEEFLMAQVEVLTRIMLTLIQRVERDGWYELACGLMAFYLLVAGVWTRGNLDRFQGIAGTIKSLKGLPGFKKYVVRAIDVVCDRAQESGRELTFSLLDQFRQTVDEEVADLIARGEGETCEFKSSLRVNQTTGKPDTRMEQGVLKTIAGFLNKQGGTLLVGVADDRSIVGIETDQFQNFDKWSLHLKNLVDRTMSGAMDYLTVRPTKVDGKTIVLIACRKSDAPVYLVNRENKSEEFYVRRGAATDRLGMKDAFDYIRRAF